MSPSDSTQELCYSQVKQIGLFNFENYDDISSVMRSRAIKMYGLQVSKVAVKGLFWLRLCSTVMHLLIKLGSHSAGTHLE